MLPRRIITDDGQRQIGEVFRDEVRALQSRDVRGCVEIKFQAPQAHEGPRNISQDNLTHCLISTQVRGHV